MIYKKREKGIQRLHHHRGIKGWANVERVHHIQGPEAGLNTENPKSMKELHAAGGKAEAERGKWGAEW